jgi:hypothetical protein
MSLAQSVFSLAKSNNGFFKSTKQADFLISKINSLEGFVGTVTSGYNSCAIFAENDDKGITKITKSTKKGQVVMFERKVEGTLTVLEIKELKKLKRAYKNLTADFNERVEGFKSGKYNGSMDITTYTVDMIIRYLEQNEIKQLAISRAKKRIVELEKINNLNK